MSSLSVRTRAVTAAVAIGAILGAGALVSPSALLATVESVSTDPILFGLVVTGLYLGRPLLALPTTPLAVVVGYGYGVAVGVPVALVGVVVTVVPVFLAVRWVAAGPPDDEAGVRSASVSESAPGPFDSILERAGAAVGRYYETAGPIRGVVASRLAPIPSDVATCAAAVSGVRLRHLVIGTAIGELPWTIAAVVVGASAATIRTGGVGDLGAALTLACLVAAIALLAAPAYRLVRDRGEQSRTTGRPADR
ncbi:SNARE associated Golgi protein-related protein [Haloterrigena turkmenica DSM 5511]|uniref:SNARE associated Golgi protein-related protein n=1 Tax=Haloterrigena turkmenica (strain ATCC 51198 / DSM 5511 / JCM 9101 / NCIMB 13204 / VKM B-1734 / 4k) TaxID=543526 RepID=D2RTR5_HALTV|nr:VTT domain-containing protein [Haloterrigena turkmenica]ADB61016.1 SNARE associated Golgi protein-related protein [Haloterrigena turkmenica DSM 5511]